MGLSHLQVGRYRISLLASKNHIVPLLVGMAYEVHVCMCVCMCVKCVPMSVQAFMFTGVRLFHLAICLSLRIHYSLEKKKEFNSSRLSQNFQFHSHCPKLSHCTSLFQMKVTDKHLHDDTNPQPSCHQLKPHSLWSGRG